MIRWPALFLLFFVAGCAPRYRQMEQRIYELENYVDTLSWSITAINDRIAADEKWQDAVKKDSSFQTDMKFK